MEQAETYAILRQHLHTFFVGHPSEEHSWALGPALTELPRLRVAEFAPGPKFPGWVYATLGAWEARPDHRLEFLITAPHQDLRHVELLAMTAWYHRKEGLGLGHTFPIGEPWLPGSACEFMLVSRPYPFGPSLEVCNIPDGHLHYLWLLPITRQERQLKIQEGQEALERRFDACGLDFCDPLRASVA
jgi:hypothetical protein